MHHKIQPTIINMKILFILCSGSTSILPQGLQRQFGHKCTVKSPDESIVVQDGMSVVVLDNAMEATQEKELVVLISKLSPSIPIVQIFPETVDYPWPLMCVRYKPPGSNHADGYTGPESPLSWDGENYLLQQAVEDCRK